MKYIRMYDGMQPYDEQDGHRAGPKPDFAMLFDLQADPRETHNLIATEKDTDVLRAMRKKCADHLQRPSRIGAQYRQKEPVKRQRGRPDAGASGC